LFPPEALEETVVTQRVTAAVAHGLGRVGAGLLPARRIGLGAVGVARDLHVRLVRCASAFAAVHISILARVELLALFAYARVVGEAFAGTRVERGLAILARLGVAAAVAAGATAKVGAELIGGAE